MEWHKTKHILVSLQQAQCQALLTGMKWAIVSFRQKVFRSQKQRPTHAEVPWRCQTCRSQEFETSTGKKTNEP